MKGLGYALLLLFPIVLLSCYKKSQAVCPDGTVARNLNTIYQAHWPVELMVSSNYTDTVFIYSYTDEDFILENTLDSGESMDTNFGIYEKYIVYVDQPDSLLSQLDSLVNIAAIYSCPEE